MESGFRKGKRFAIVRQKPRGIGLDSVKPKDAKSLHRQILGLVDEAYPGAHVVESYVAGIMPANFTETMSEEEIRGLVAWLLDPNR